MSSILGGGGVVEVGWGRLEGAKFHSCKGGGIWGIVQALSAPQGPMADIFISLHSAKLLFSGNLRNFLAQTTCFGCALHGAHSMCF